jgi:serine/threonine protein kinase
MGTTSSSLLRVGEEIGKGAYGAVFKGEYEGRVVAVKKIHDTLMGYAGRDNGAYIHLVSEFKKECQMLESLEHPHIVKFIAVIGRSREALLVMEIMTETLDKRIKRSPTPSGLEKMEAAWICCQVADGLAYLHSRDPPVVHRDLTTKNILLNDVGVAKISDLGVAKFRPTALGFMSTEVPGCVPYMPPEALSSQPHYTEKLDVFSLGVVMGVTATGRDPPYNLHGIGVVPEIKRREDYLQRVDSTHPLKPLIIRCLENDFCCRPSAREVHMELKPLPYPPSLTQSRSNTEERNILSSPLVKNGKAKLQFCLILDQGQGCYALDRVCLSSFTYHQSVSHHILMTSGVAVALTLWFYPLQSTIDYLFFHNDGVLLFLDLSDPNCVESTKKIHGHWLQEVGDYDIPLILIGTQPYNSHRAVSVEDIEHLAQSLSCQEYVELKAPHSGADVDVKDALNIMIELCLYQHLP